MQIVLDEVRREGTEVALAPGLDWVRRAVETALEGRLVSAEGRLLLELRDDGDVLVGGEVAVRCARSCDRCGGEVELAVEGPLELVYVPALSEGEELVGSELDQGIYEEGTVDLELVLQEHLALQLPARLTCDDPGVTPLEEGDCVSPGAADVPEETVDPRFAILGSLRLDD